ncbi:telomerase reverse transcriptase-like [Aricia agestis]|uniref:telomerase reverse transcriptase-like n=1 Tax=Aricia agestis TaxID=91739 RepID=UPI001C203FCF|nr:telomerase reverse transcriptase-like [Aricia agestis]
MPIVIYKKDVPNLKQRIKEKLYFLRVISGISHKRIESQYLALYRNWISHNKPKLYFIKTDLTNAFGSIDIKVLLKVLCERHQKFQSQEKSLSIKKKFALLYRQFVNEIRSPLLIRTGSTYYEWNRGLVQGYKYSPALSELYYSYMDEIYFADFIQKRENRINLFVRVVDDYLYITDCLEDAQLFLNALNNYKNVNYNKTIVNFAHENIRQSSFITFLGYTYDTKKLNVCRAKNVYVGQMCYKIAFTQAISNVSKFIENRIGQSGIFVSSHIFNLHYNDEALVWKHIFTTLCHCANKFCTILAVLCQESDMPKYLALYKRKVSNSLCSSIINTLKKNKPDDFQFVYCINHFKYLSYKALLLCVKETSKCSKLIPFVEASMSKTNCIFGKWSQHYSRITVDRNILAVREQCRRQDLRVIMKDFNTLPKGFECFKTIKSI